MLTKQKIGFLGGTFNPIHNAHLRIAEEIREILMFDKIIFVPSFTPPLKTNNIAEADYRFEMVKLAIEHNKYFELSDIEFNRNTASYTALTVKELNTLYNGNSLYLLLGIDAFLEIDKWHMPQLIIDNIDIVVVSRSGYNLNNVFSSKYIEKQSQPLNFDNENPIRCSLINKRQITLFKATKIEISSTSIRRLIKEGKSIKYLLPEKVESFIIGKGLYK
ncbi:putative nicotinate-nucleotide adenylyltransferase [Candidatus Magnetoovum chiemensis]|nr:putative nicotinate-nucleotide adenylyltransferase [Candidatus Magnetoovum chiemensis]